MSSIDPATWITPTNFIGWSTSAESTQPFTCNLNLPWATSDTYAGCVYKTGDSAVFATSCYQGSIVYSGTTAPCSNTAYSCEVLQIFETEGDSTPAWTMYNCVASEYTLNLYRHLTGISTSTDSLTVPASTDAGTITAASTTFSTATSSSSATGDPVPSDNSGNTSLSGGAIAGITIGAVAGIILLVLVLFRRRILACCGYTRAPDHQSVYAPVYPFRQSPGQYTPGPQSISQPQSPPPWDKPELAADTGHSTAPYRHTLHEME